jgi:hypothetical protein
MANAEQVPLVAAPVLPAAAVPASNTGRLRLRNCLRGWGGAVITIVTVGAMIATAAWAPGKMAQPYRFWIWMILLALLGGYILFAGFAVSGYWRGCLVDDRNKISLSRLQLVLWTLILLSAYLTFVALRIAAGNTDSLTVAIPGPLWLLMGISTTSLVGSPLILNTKRSSNAPAADVAAAQARATAQSIPVPEVEGLVTVHPDVANASWLDLFQGEEVGNCGYLDIGKIQMFYFTIVVALSYCVDIGHMLCNGPATLDKLPTVSEGMLALLGISHTGYLANKAAPH